MGHKTGSGAPMSAQDLAVERRERLRRLAMETIDLSKDPYMMRNHLGQIECKLCLTLHTNESSYLSHTQGKKHQTNLSRRAAKEKAESNILPQQKKIAVKHSMKIGRPGYRVSKLRDPETRQRALLFEIDYPDVDESIKPRHRFMSAWEQRTETPDAKFQYLLFAAEPYETIAFKIPNLEIDRNDDKFYVDWNDDKKVYTMQVFLKDREDKILPALPQRPTTFLPIGVRW